MLKKQEKCEIKQELKNICGITGVTMLNVDGKTEAPKAMAEQILLRGDR